MHTGSSGSTPTRSDRATASTALLQPATASRWYHRLTPPIWTAYGLTAVLGVLLALTASTEESREENFKYFSLAWLPYIFFTGPLLQYLSDKTIGRLSYFRETTSTTAATTTTSTSTTSTTETSQAITRYTPITFSDAIRTTSFTWAMTSTFFGYALVNAEHGDLVPQAGLSIFLRSLLTPGSAIPNGWLNSNQILALIYSLTSIRSTITSLDLKQKLLLIPYLPLALLWSIGGSIAMYAAIAKAAASTGITNEAIPSNVILFLTDAFGLLFPPTIKWLLKVPQALLQGFINLIITPCINRIRKTREAVYESIPTQPYEKLKSQLKDIFEDPAQRVRFLARMEAILRKEIGEIIRKAEKRIENISSTETMKAIYSESSTESTNLSLTITIDTPFAKEIRTLTKIIENAKELQSNLENPFVLFDLINQENVKTSFTKKGSHPTSLSEIIGNVITDLNGTYRPLNLTRIICMFLAFSTAITYCYISASEIPDAASTPGTGLIGQMVQGILDFLTGIGFSTLGASIFLNTANFIFPADCALKGLLTFSRFIQDLYMMQSVGGPTRTSYKIHTLAASLGLLSVGTVLAMGRTNPLAYPAAANAAFLNSSAISPEVYRLIYLHSGKKEEIDCAESFFRAELSKIESSEALVKLVILHLNNLKKIERSEPAMLTLTPALSVSCAANRGTGNATPLLSNGRAATSDGSTIPFASPDAQGSP